MNGWENFFIGELGASAALIGLVFVGISINLKKIMASSYLPNIALEALSAFVSTLFIAFLMLIPQQSFLTDGIEVLCVGLLTWIMMIYLHIDTFRKAPSTYRYALIVHQFMTYHLAALSFIGASVSFLIWGAPGFYWLVAATLLSYLAAFVDTWLLAVEINR
jgi:modulator of FtsH protease